MIGVSCFAVEETSQMTRFVPREEILHATAGVLFVSYVSRIRRPADSSLRLPNNDFSRSIHQDSLYNSLSSGRQARIPTVHRRMPEILTVHLCTFSPICNKYHFGYIFLPQREYEEDSKEVIQTVQDKSRVFKVQRGGSTIEGHTSSYKITEQTDEGNHGDLPKKWRAEQADREQNMGPGLYGGSLTALQARNPTQVRRPSLEHAVSYAHLNHDN